MISCRRFFQNRRHLIGLSAIAGIGLASLLASAFAHEKQHLSYKSLPENTKFTQQNIIDVGDVPGHQVRIYEIHRTYPTNPPMINGLRLVEQWSRGTSDYIDNSSTCAASLALAVTIRNIQVDVARDRECAARSGIQANDRGRTRD